MVELTAEEHAILNGNFERIAEEIRLERHRQIVEEGFSPKHDERHAPSDFAMAAAAYCASAEARLGPSPNIGTICAMLWPWDEASFKPKDPRRDLVRAAALVMAAIERLDREALIAPEVEGA